MALDFQETIIAAGLNHNKRITLLENADVTLAQLQRHVRLCKDLELMSVGRYEHAARMMVEIGRLLGGWRKTVK